MLEEKGLSTGMSLSDSFEGPGSNLGPSGVYHARATRFQDSRKWPCDKFFDICILYLTERGDM